MAVSIAVICYQKVTFLINLLPRFLLFFSPGMISREIKREEILITRLILQVPRVINANFLLTISIHNKEKKVQQ